MHSVWSQKAVLAALFQSIGVQRIAEVCVGVFVILPQRRRCHAHLKCRLEVFQDLAPVAFVPRATAVALVHDDEVKEVACKLSVKSWPPLVSRNRLVSRKIHLAAFDHLPFDLPTRVAERRENLRS